MGDSTAEKIKAFNRVPRLHAFDIHASFGEGQPGRIEQRLIDASGKRQLDEQAWEAGEVAYRCLKLMYPSGITASEFAHVANEFYSIACEEIYPVILGLAEAGKLDIRPAGIEGMKAAWAEYDWCERVMLAFDFIDGIDFPHENPLNTTLPLVLLQRLDDAVIASILDGSGLFEVTVEIASLKDRLEPPKHVEMKIQKLQGKLHTFAQARRKGADALHAEHRSMKADVFAWLDSQARFKSIESAAMAITKQQPIAHVTARGWYKEWKKLRSASTP